MKIVLSGVETNNKGAELMLYAILQEIERKFPEAEVYISPNSIRQGLDYVKTSLDLRYWPLTKLLNASHFNGILRRLRQPMLEGVEFLKADYFLDGSGFLFSDQTSLWGTTPERWEHLLKHFYHKSTKIVFLPQAFGPINENKTKEAMKVLNRYASVIMPREKVSFDYINESGLVDMKKVKLYTDFTSLVEGVFPDAYEHLRDGICIIPNMRMIDKGKITYENYIKLISVIIEEGKKSCHPVYLLNHEGKGDEWLAYKCKKSIGETLDVVTGLNALEVKGLIASAYLVITSRYHGLASSLNSGVPALATSWSHKYQELFNDYNMSEGILPLDNRDQALEKVRVFLSSNYNTAIRHELQQQIPIIVAETQEMWRTVWQNVNM